MNRRVRRWGLAAAAAGLLLTGAVTALEAGDSLISLSYLTDTFIPAVVAQGNEVEDKKLTDAYNVSKEILDQVTEQGFDDGVSAGSAVFSAREFARGEHISLETGSGFLMLAGEAAVSHDGVVIDITNGAEVPSGERLSPGRRYLVGEDTKALVIVRSGLARGGIQGPYAHKINTEQAAPFTDVTVDDWYCPAVDYVYYNGLFAGMGDDKFAPMSSMDRSMMMTVLYHLAGDPEEERKAATASFTDVPENQWYHSFVSWAAEQGVSAGTGDGKFSPAQPVTREQVVVLLYNFAVNYMGMTLEERMDLSACADYDRVASWSLDALSWATGSGVLSVPQGGALEPDRAASRAEVASMLMNFSRKYLED